MEDGRCGTVEPTAQPMSHCLGAQLLKQGRGQGLFWHYSDHRSSKVCGMHISGPLFRVAGAYHSRLTGDRCCTVLSGCQTLLFGDPVAQVQRAARFTHPD